MADPFEMLMASANKAAPVSSAAQSDPFSAFLAANEQAIQAKAKKEQEAPKAGEKIGAGFVQGLRDAGITAMQMGQAYTSALPSFLTGSTPEREAKASQGLAEAKSETDAFNQRFGDSTIAGLSRVGGNVLATAPMVAGASQFAGAIPAVGAVGDAVVGLGSRAPALNRLLGYGVAATEGAAQGALGNALISGGTGQDLGDALATGAMFGAGANAGLAMAGDAGRALFRSVRGTPVDPATAQLAQAARESYNIPVNAAQVSGSPAVKYFDSATGKLPFMGAEKEATKQAAAFTRAVAKTIGEDADGLTQEVMSRARTRIGQMFDDVAAKTTVNPGAVNKLLNDIGQIQAEAGQAVAASELAPVNNLIDNILEKAAAGGGQIEGSVYQAITRRGAPLDRAIRSADPNVSFYASRIREALDDALEVSAAPDVLETLKTARSQWKNMRTVEGLAARADPSGRISPNGLLNAVVRSYDDFAYRGGGDLGELAKIGKQFIKEPPSSGTAERALVYKALEKAGEAAPAAIGVGGVAALNPMAGAAAMGGLMAGWGIGRAGRAILRSDMLTNRLIAAALNNSGGAAAQAVPNALMQRLPPYLLPTIGAEGGTQLFLSPGSVKTP